ncbi:MAG: hypothetical protein AUG74_12720 [Bacteroidetes bacterium 13_1_20CM_4_60_6]|nr:MAG: hypothetical protein AUG74_12720 [Bacteroidetes bacterium 13_1_20CM_4_60_6]
MALWNSKLAQRLSHIVLPCLLGSAALRAQESATLRGVVTDKSSGKAVVDAQIIMLEDTRSASSDSSGRYEISGLRPGASKLVVRAVGFPPLRVDVELIAGKTTDRAIQLDSTDAGRLASAQSLPAVSVSAPATPFNYRLADFERRRQTGRGQYLTEDEITKSGAYNIADAVKTMRGVNYECGGGAGCYVRMARAPMRCLPEFIVDGQVMNDFGPVTPIRDIVGLEVYTGPTEVPGEYAGRYAGCGVIVVWTRSGPTRKRK